MNGTSVVRWLSLVLLAGGVALGVGLGTGAPPLARLSAYEQDPPRTSPLVGTRPTPRTFPMVDGVLIQGRQYVHPSRGMIIVIHGLGSHDRVAQQIGDSLRLATQFNVMFLDLRGNGRSDGVRGRLAHDDQYSEDIGSVVRALKRSTPSGPVLLLGVRQGAGPALAYAARVGAPGTAEARRAPPVQGLALIEPILDFTTLLNATLPDDDTLQWHHRRLQTQRLLNRAGVHIADRLPVAFQRTRHPDGPHARNFSWRAIRTLLPSDPWTVLNTVTVPVLLLSSHPETVAKLRRTDTHDVARLGAPALAYASPTWRTLEQWTAQFSAAAELPPTVLPYVPVPILDRAP